MDITLATGESKDLVSVNTILGGEGDWACVKEVIRWIVNTKAETVALPERNIQELRNLLAIPTNQRQMGRTDMERLAGKLRSMHLAFPGAVTYLYHLKRALAQAGADRSWISPEFHYKILDWRMLADQTAD